MPMIIDTQKLHAIMSRPARLAGPDELRRDGTVFFVGGNLAVNETLETMFESFCTESTDLFHLTFGEGESFHRGEELARQIKRNFNVRLMGRLEHAVPPAIIERVYAAGVDILDISSAGGGEGLHTVLSGADRLFPRWSVASTLVLGAAPPAAVAAEIDILLHAGVMPLVALSPRAARYPSEAVAALFGHLASGWARHHAAVKPFLPLISLTTPLVPAGTTGRLRGLISRLHDRQWLAASDLRRHLRVKGESDSLDSAGL
ncbi:MAG TPA: hypothetical protein VF795_01715 [Desulfuromonadaceae bacterium]